MGSTSTVDQVVSSGRVQGRPGASQVGPEVGHGCYQGVQGYARGRVVRLSMVGRGLIRGWKVGQVSQVNPYDAVVALSGRERFAPDTLTESFARVACPSCRFGKRQPSVRGLSMVDHGHARCPALASLASFASWRKRIVRIAGKSEYASLVTLGDRALATHGPPLPLPTWRTSWDAWGPPRLP